MNRLAKLKSFVGLLCWTGLPEKAVLEARRTMLCVVPIKRRKSLVPIAPEQQFYLRNLQLSPEKRRETFITAMEEAMIRRKLAPRLWDKLSKGPLRVELYKATEMKTLSFLYYAICFFSAHNLIPVTEANEAKLMMDAMLDEILSLDRFLHFDNRLTVSRVMLGMSMVDNLDREKLRRMSYKVMSRLKRLHPTALIDVLFSWVKLEWDNAEDYQSLSAELLLHKDLLSASLLAKVIWAWSQLGPWYNDHICIFLSRFAAEEKLSTAVIEDIGFVMASTGRPDCSPYLHTVLDRFFSQFDLQEAPTHVLVQVFVAMSLLRQDDPDRWQRMLKLLGSYAHLRHFKPEDYVSVLQAFIDRNLKDPAFVDRFLFEAAQQEMTRQFSLNDLVSMRQMSDSLQFANIAQIFAEEIRQRQSTV